MKKIGLDLAQAGDILAKDLLSPKGLLVLNKGARLTAPILARLHKIALTELFIEGDGDELSAAARQQQLDLLERRFSGHENNALMMELKRIVASHLQQ
jgi:hypothetical protein